MYGQPARAMRRRAQERQYAAEVRAWYGDGEAILDRVGEYLSKEWGRAVRDRDVVRERAVKGAQAVVRGALQRVLTEDSGLCPF